MSATGAELHHAIRAARSLGDELAPIRAEELRKRSHARFRQRRVVRVAVVPSVGAVLVAALFFSRASTPREQEEPPRLADGTAIATDNDAVLWMTEHTAGVERYVLARGSARFDVAPNPVRRFIVEAPGATIEVLGTIFTVTVVPEGVSVFVEEGRVKVTNARGQSVALVRESYFVPHESSRREPEQRGSETAPAKAVSKPAQARIGHAPQSAKAATNVDPNASLQHAEELLQRGQTSAAESVFGALLESNESSLVRAFAAFHLGRLATDRGEPGRARDLFLRCAALAKDTPLADDARERLRQLP